MTALLTKFDLIQRRKNNEFSVPINEVIQILDYFIESLQKDNEWFLKTLRHYQSYNTSKAGRAKKSPYEKAGTIAAVNALLAENKQLLAERGGKAKLNRMIMDLIAENQIPAPDTPTQKTVDSWIDKFKNTEMN